MRQDTEMDGASLLVGIFVGGRSLRMGTPKGLLRAPGESGLTLLGRTALTAQKAFPGARQVLVGVRPEYGDFPLPVLRDAAKDSGPLGGLVALLREAERAGASFVIALGCDFPYLSVALLQKLAGADPGQEVIAPRDSGYYQPLVARYKTSARSFFEAALVARQLALQPLLRDLNASELLLDPGQEKELRDWDEPSDIAG
jgi:molybdopterin-guanine dinucleotide biosynthesis protein A